MVPFYCFVHTNANGLMQMFEWPSRLTISRVWAHVETTAPPVNRLCGRMMMPAATATAAATASYSASGSGISRCSPNQRQHRRSRRISSCADIPAAERTAVVSERWDVRLCPGQQLPHVLAHGIKGLLLVQAGLVQLVTAASHQAGGLGSAGRGEVFRWEGR